MSLSLHCSLSSLALVCAYGVVTSGHTAVPCTAIHFQSFHAVISTENTHVKSERKVDVNHTLGVSSLNCLYGDLYCRQIDSFCRQKRLAMQEQNFEEKIRQYFISLDLKPGDKIETEVTLATRFGTTRYRMRQTLDAMVAAGILERAPKRGTIFKGFDTGSLSEHIKFQFEVSRFDSFEFKEARVLMERAILPLAVRRITPSDIAKAEQTIADMLLHKDDPQKADTYDRDFHLIIFTACGNHVLSAFSGVIQTLFRDSEYRNKYWSPDYVEKIAAEHRLILQAVKKGDPLAALAALDAHLGYSKITFME